MMHHSNAQDFPPSPRLIGYIVAQPNKLPQLRLADRGICTFCKGERRIVEDGQVIACPDCRGQGVELRREDHFALDDDDSLDDMAGTQAACIECGGPYTPLDDTDKLCSRCYAWNKL